MGYRAKYALRTDPSHDAHIRAEILKRHPAASPFCADSNWNDDTGCKWYSSAGDCAEVSMENPGIKFSIYGLGEHDHDLWVRHYEGGSYVELTVSFDEIDEMMEGDIAAREAGS
jgi:hypothetical protein